jgi:hypothetical protein
VVGVVLAIASSVSAQSEDPSLQSRLKAHVTYLASPELEGRASGSQGVDKARDYIASQFEQIGLHPAGEDGYVTAFSAVTHAKPSRETTLQIGEHVLAQNVEFRPASFSGDVRFDAPAVFVGYGLSAPSIGYDDYAGVDVRGKVVIALSGAPAAHKTALVSGESAYLLSSASKAAVALSKGARALLLINDPRGHGVHPEQQADHLPLLRPTPALDGIAVGHLTEKAAVRTLASAEANLAGVQREIDATSTPQSRPLGLTIKGNLSLERQTSTLYNVQATLAATEPSSTEPSETNRVSKGPLIITAHYDGLGFGHAGSLSDEPGSIHPGADDNASGVAVLIELARALAAEPPESRRPILFAAPAGEELGLHGSRQLARTLMERSTPGMVVNFDMLGRLRDRQIRLAHGPDDTALRELVDSVSHKHGLSILAESLNARFSDHVSFVELGVRGLNITTGRHGDYHMPGDTLDKLNCTGLGRVHGFIEDTVRGLAAR